MENKIPFLVAGIAILVSSVIVGMNLASESAIKPKFTDDNMISLERTVCYGACPAYSVTVFKSGTVMFEGKSFVENIGVYRYRISTTDAEKIFEKFYEINFFSLDDRYEIPVTDLPTAITTFKNDAYSKTISNYGNAGPDKLKELEMLIDNLANISKMITVKIPEQGKDLSSAFEMKPNSMQYFYYPNPDDIENRDAFSKFMLIRLPEELGGSANDVSSFRAYSALSVGEHCLVKYWPEEGRKRIEEPCWGSIYRPIDGLMIMAPKPITNTAPVALPYLSLSEYNGTLYVEPPVWTLQENGVVGIGRQISREDIRQGSQIITNTFSESHPNHPDIPVEFAGYVLTEINYNNGIEARYSDFITTDWHHIYLKMYNAPAQSQKYFPNFAAPDSEFWQIGDSIIKVGGSKVEFINQGFKFEITGEDTEFIKKEIVKNYFPEYSYDEMFLVSSTIE